MAALFEQRLGMRFLEIARANLRGGDVGRDRQNWNTRPMTVEQAVNEMEIARAAAAGTNSEGAGEMRFRAGRKSGNFLMPNVDPFDLLLAADRIGDAVQAVAND